MTKSDHFFLFLGLVAAYALSWIVQYQVSDLNDRVQILESSCQD
jgi:hypothetical protein